jgi:glycosyltransferase involved in cell wall biosynthesis
MIPVYNGAQYLPDALLSVLIQSLPEENMQIEVVDDASTDADVKEIVERIGKGRIKYYRQEVNVGSLRNFETCLNRSKGEIVHLLHGDDRVRPGFYKKISGLFAQYPEVGAAFCRYNYIDEKGAEKLKHPAEMAEDGILENWLLRIAEACSIQYVSIAVKREVYERLGSFYGLIYGEDWEMWVRIARIYQVAYTPEILADYRSHDSSITGNKFLNGGVLKDMKQVIELIRNYIPEAKRRTARKMAIKKASYYGIEIARMVWFRTKNTGYVNANIMQVIKMNILDRYVIKSIFNLYVQIFKSGIRELLSRSG